MTKHVILKPGKDHSARSGHPWIFSGAIAGIDDGVETGDIVTVFASDNTLVGVGTFSKYSGIAVRLFSFSDETIDGTFIESRLREANKRRELAAIGPLTSFSGYRVVFGEADGLPGIIIDRYNDVFVLQLGHAGAERMRGLLVDAIDSLFSPRAIVERSDVASRREDNLQPISQVLKGEDPGAVPFSEGDMTFLAYPASGQKTGFYLDQRQLRAAIRPYSTNANVLNLFSYTGACGIAALKGGAEQITNVDSSESALQVANELADLNGFRSEKVLNVCDDVFQWLAKPGHPTYSMIALDPPALIKRKSDIGNGRKGYHFLARAALRLMQSNGVFVMSSCSQFFPLDDLLATVRRAASQAERHCELLDIVLQPPDHPILTSFPESWYLKSIICRIR